MLFNSMMPEISDTCMFLTTAKDIWDAVLQSYSKALDATQLKRDSLRQCPEDATILKNYIEKDRVYDFLVGLNDEFDQVRVQILSKEFPTSNETIFIIQVEESRRSVMLEPKIWKAQLWLLTKGVIRRLVLLITKRLIDQDLQIVITRITYGALTARSLDIHRRNARNFMHVEDAPRGNPIHLG
ncbi:hypothetical protein CK203_035401 [Vitis vinifera]|uniref:Retrovirus-related Pol polyprotein from transposon RE1 n=1 Tax=Vitis vinifera TaxID=29760 RepID=A0A438I3T1_VITVI|nr:hypothetical protein CK203_035401 [Vitis vinifera]